MKWKRFQRVVVAGAVGGGLALEILHGEDQPHVHPNIFEPIEIRVKDENRASTGEDMWVFASPEKND